MKSIKSVLSVISLLSLIACGDGVQFNEVDISTIEPISKPVLVQETPTATPEPVVVQTEPTAIIITTEPDTLDLNRIKQPVGVIVISNPEPLNPNRIKL